MLVDALLLEALGGLGPGTAIRAFHLGLDQRCLDGLARLLQGVAGGRAVDPLAGKAGGIDLDIAGQDDQIRLGDLVVGQLILSAHRALGLDAYLMAEPTPGLGQCLGGHEGVGDPGGTGGHRDDARLVADVCSHGAIP